MGLWDLAERDFAAAFRLQKPSTPQPWICRTLLALYAGDLDAYRAGTGGKHPVPAAASATPVQKARMFRIEEA